MLPAIYTSQVQLGTKARCAGPSLDELRRFSANQVLSLHDGCVNRMAWNASGTRLASGSDDRTVVIWAPGRDDGGLTPETRIFTGTKLSHLLAEYRALHVCLLLPSFSSGHIANIFGVRFMPHTGDMKVATCARDGQVS